uniref:Multidrug resistance-associated protein 1 n=3 Tax=Timema TaxID=61471 RepID=A0A7R9GPV1_TIMCR|nr:unnamed protein product [Timema cristinae]
MRLSTNYANGLEFEKVGCRECKPTFSWRENGKPFREPSSTKRDSNLGLPVLSSLPQYETNALANYATELANALVVLSSTDEDGDIEVRISDANLTWYTEAPDITPCFQKTVLVWLPCAVLWAACPLETFYILNSKTRDIPWNFHNVSQMVSIDLTSYVASECHKLKKKQNENEKKAQVAEVEEAEFSLATNTSLEVDSVLFTSWYLDSGASEHMICATYCHLLTNIHNLPSPTSIKLAKSGENLKVTEVGDLYASFEMDGKINVIKLGSILIMPGLQHNFLSVRRLDFNGCKILTSTLILLSLVDFGAAIYRYTNGYEVYSVAYYSPAVKVATLSLSLTLLVYLRENGLRTSFAQFLFFLVHVICGVPQFKTELISLLQNEAEYSPTITYLVYYVISVLVFILTCFVDKPPNFSQHPKVEKPCPEKSVSFPSRMFFTWLDPLVWKGYRSPLTHDQLWNLNPEDTSRAVVPKFDRRWDRAVKEASGISSDGKVSYSKSSIKIDFAGDRKTKTPYVSLLMPLIKAFGDTFVMGSFLKMAVDMLTFANPQILKQIIGFVEGDEPVWKGYMYALLMLVCGTVQIVLHGHYFIKVQSVGLRVRTALVSAIYRKALRLSSTARKDRTVGEIVNLMAVDAQRLMDICLHVNLIWSAPIQIGLAVYFLWDLLGPSVLAGLAVMIILIPVNSAIANQMKKLQIRQMKYKDNRVKMMNEILCGIRVLKQYAWEPSFEQHIQKLRAKEIDVLKQAAYLHGSTSFIWTCAPYIVSLVSFATYVLIDENHVLDAQRAFVSLSLFNIMRQPLAMVPQVIASLIQASVSLTRLNTFINDAELDPSSVAHDQFENTPLHIEKGNFAWGPDEPPVLKNISLRVREGALVAIVGMVGSGKSSLISAMLGEMDKLSGTVNTKSHHFELGEEAGENGKLGGSAYGRTAQDDVDNIQNGSIAYVPQQAWIQNATVQYNITFGQEVNNKTYHKVVSACALRADLDMLPGGDQTEIGEKGINMSGGQKQRVSLARAVYSDANIYFLDDPLSAVDSHVGKHIFEEVIGPAGLLRKKTRILVTHSITYLPTVDEIVVLKNGEVSEMDLEEIKQQLETAIGRDEFQRQMSVSASSVSGSRSDIHSLGGRSRSSSLRRVGSVSSMKMDNTKQPSNGSLQTENKGKHMKFKGGRRLIEAEVAQTGSVKWHVYGHYFRSIGTMFIVGTLLFNAFFQSFQVGTNMWLSAWSTNAYGAQNETGAQDLYLGVYGALGIGQVLSVLVSMLSVSIGAINAASVLHNTLLANVFRLPQSLFDTTPIGRILTRFSSDVNVLDQTFPMILRMAVPNVYKQIYVSTSRQLKRLQSISNAPILSNFGESLTGVPTIRAYGIQERFTKMSEDLVDRNQMCFYLTIMTNRWLSVRLETIGNIIIFFSSIFAVLGRDTMDPGLVGLSISYAMQITQSLNMLVRQTSDIETNIVAVERIKEYAAYKQEAPWENPSHPVAPDWPQEGHVVFRDYKLRYREGLDLVLRGINVTVEGGEKVGIVGRTGAGKSSLTLALFRIIEAADGSILIDGEDISQLGLHTLRSRLTIIPQDPVLFSGTLRRNLDPFATFSDIDVWQALEHAHLKTFVKSLPAGLNHEVSEGGENLSVGQRQLVCLARALLRKTKLLILDEATAAVDLDTDDLIQTTIRTKFSDCTVLTIAHRLNTIMDMNRVMVLDKGLVIEFNTPEALLQDKTSVFYSMAKDAGLV